MVYTILSKFCGGEQMITPFFGLWDAYFHSYLVHLQSAGRQCVIVEISHVILCGSRFRRTWEWLIKNLCATHWNFLDQIFTIAIEGEEYQYTASMRLLISLLDFPYKNRFNHR